VADYDISEQRRIEFNQKTTNFSDRPEYFFDPVRSPYGPGDRAWAACVLASKDRLPNTVQEFAEDDSTIDVLPRFPSTLEPIDREYGGFFGVTSLIAEPGIGKTLLAWAVALTAAATQKWNVVYLGGELDIGEMIERRAREMTVHTGAIDGADYLKMVQVGIGQGTLDFCYELAGLDPDIPTLILADSINTLATLSRKDYLRSLEDFAIWAMMARRLSRGAASFLLVSETNKRGNSKGEKLEFWSDLAIGMTGKKDETAVDFTIKKIRRGKWTHLGMFHRHWDSNRFYTQEQMDKMRQPRLVAVGDEF
jgi:predicted ATP-dependent serine protease